MESKQRLLCPTWHSVSLKDELQNRWTYSFDLNALPDHGGVGVDVKFEDGRSTIFCPKSGKVESHFGAEKYTLPFLSPAKVSLSVEPCMEEIKKLHGEQATFCANLWHTKQSIKKMKKEKAQKVLSECYGKITTQLENGTTGSVTVPKSVYETSMSFPDSYPTPIANWKYIGGCLDSFNSPDGNIVLLHPGGKKINKLIATRINVQRDSSNKSERQFELVEQDFAKLSGGLVYQIDAQRTSGRELCCVRKLNCCHVVSVRLDSQPLKIEKVTNFSSEEQLASVRLSPFVPGECLLTMSSGQIYLYSVDNNNCLWSTPKPLWEGSRWSSGFSAGPRLVSVVSQHQLSQADLRSKPHRPLTLFTSSNGHLLPFEELIFSSRHPQQSSQCFLATTHHLLLCDHRYPNHPVQIWNHMLTSVPVHCSAVPLLNCKEIVVLLGAQESRQACCIQLQSTDAVQPASLAPPWHLSTPVDFGRALRLQGVPVPTRRLLAPLTGTRVVPRLDGGFTAFQLTSLGDLFYQDFFVKTSLTGEKNFCFGPGCDLLPPKEMLSDIEEWLVDDRDATVIEKKMPRSMSCVQLRKDILKKQTSALRCALCMPKVGKCVDKDICPSCGLHVDASLQLVAAKHEGNILCGRVPGCSVDDRYTKDLKLDVPQSLDSLSKKLLQVWMTDENKSTDVDQTENFDEDANVLRSLLVPASHVEAIIEEQDDEVEMVYSTASSKRRAASAVGF